MKISNLCVAFICGTCSSLMCATPLEGRFLQVDPVGYKDQSNLYAYVADDPANRTDPTGNQMLPNPFASEEIRDFRAGWNESMANRLWEAERHGYFTIAGVTSLFLVPEEAPAIATFGSASALLRGSFVAGRVTAGRTTQFIGSGGIRGAAALFRQLVGDTSFARSGNAVVGRLAEGARVNIRSVIQGDIRRTTVEIQRAGQTGTRIAERLKIRFDERWR